MNKTEALLIPRGRIMSLSAIVELISDWYKQAFKALFILRKIYVE